MSRQTLRFALGAVVLVVVLLSVVVLVVLLGRWSDFEREVAAELAGVRAAGQPVCLEDLSWYYPAPAADQDVTATILEALSLLPQLGDYQPEKMVANWDAHGPPENGPPQDRYSREPEEVDRCLRQYQRVIDLLEEAGRRGGAARYPTEREESRWTDDCALRLKSAGYLLALKAHVCAEHGDAAGTADAIRGILGLARSLEGSPRYISFVLRQSSEALACDAIARHIPQVSISTEDLVGFDKALARPDEPAEMVAALVGERFDMIIFLQDEFRNQSTQSAFGRIAARESQHDFAQYLRYMDEAVACAAKPWPDSYRDAQQLSVRWDKIASQASLPITRMCKLALPEMLKKSERAKAVKNAARLVLAMERFRRDQHGLPHQLEAIVPRYLDVLPKDAFSGRPLRWFVDEDGLVVYSVGPNGADDRAESDDPSLRVKYTVEQMGTDRRHEK